MGILGDKSDAAAPKGCGAVMAETNVGSLFHSDSNESGSATSLSGVVQAILDIGRQRQALLDQLRSSLESGNDAEALRFARLYCGLTDGRKP